MLRTWEDIRGALRRYPIRTEGEDLVTFDWVVAGQVTEIFQAKCADVAGRQRVFLGVNICEDHPAAAHEALLVNSETVIGMLAAFRGQIVLRHTVTVGGFDEAEWHEIIETMARTAEGARARLLSQAPGPHSTYVD